MIGLIKGKAFIKKKKDSKLLDLLGHVGKKGDTHPCGMGGRDFRETKNPKKKTKV